MRMCTVCYRRLVCRQSNCMNASRWPRPPLPLACPVSALSLPSAARKTEKVPFSLCPSRQLRPVPRHTSTTNVHSPTSLSLSFIHHARGEFYGCSQEPGRQAHPIPSHRRGGRVPDQDGDPVPRGKNRSRLTEHVAIPLQIVHLYVCTALHPALSCSAVPLVFVVVVGSGGRSMRAAVVLLPVPGPGTAGPAGQSAATWGAWEGHLQ